MNNLAYILLQTYTKENDSVFENSKCQPKSNCETKEVRGKREEQHRINFVDTAGKPRINAR